MEKPIDPNFILQDAIASEAYLTTMITCLQCERDLMASELKIEEPNDPMEEWAKKFTKAAKGLGWSISPTTGAILCNNCYAETYDT